MCVCILMTCHVENKMTLKKEKAAVGVKGQMTDGPIAKNFFSCHVLTVYKISFFYHKANDSTINLHTFNRLKILLIQ